MSITKQQVLSVVNNRLNRAETSIDTELTWALVDLSSRDDFLKKEAYRHTAEGKKDYLLPGNFREMKLLQVKKNNRFSPPLEKLRFNRYRMLATDMEYKAEPEYYALQENTLWLFPVPNEVMELRLFYTIYHPEDLDNIEFTHPYREAIYQGTLLKVAEKYGLDNAIQRHLQLYEMEIQKLSANLSRKEPPAVTQYRDI